MKCSLVRFLTYVIGSSFANIVKIEIQEFEIKMM